MKFSEFYEESSLGVHKQLQQDLNTGADYNGKEVINDIHMTKIGYDILGKRLAEKAIELIKEK
ncbi:hypothetical protein [Polaribacter sp.]|uniref:hypothetical protein n=1 Tax=Polaribacter sp. TaxID=1920175 RepID=UPI003BB07CCC